MFDWISVPLVYTQVLLTSVHGFNISIGLHSVKQMEQLLLLNAVGHYILYVMSEDPMRFLGGSGKVVDRLN